MSRLSNLLIGSCRHVAGILLLREERPLTLGERLRLRLHMPLCDACPRFERQVSFMRVAMDRWRHYGDDETP